MEKVNFFPRKMTRSSVSQTSHRSSFTLCVPVLAKIIFAIYRIPMIFPYYASVWHRWRI